ncbi:hypothetical protein CPB86DRAFT_762356 [Serendipita vermifera]|nr:hypothetical protein CPB86DRAFT_762356 [Serendipita vermifera]
MFYILPPEILLLILSLCPVQDIHSCQRVCQAANKLVKDNTGAIYHNVAIFYNMVPPHKCLQDILDSRDLYFDWLKPRPDAKSPIDTEQKAEDGWKKFVRTQFLLEHNWKTGQATQRHRHFSPQGPHRIQIDEVEGTVIATHVNSVVQVEHIEDETITWQNYSIPRWAHCEFDKGFLIWSRNSGKLEVWRRMKDQRHDPIPACNPDFWQQRAVLQPPSSPLEDDSDMEGSSPPTSPISTRGRFEPFIVLSPPMTVSASRFVYPQLLVATREQAFAYLYDVPSGNLVKTITINDSTGTSIHYVEHGPRHIYICTEAAVSAYRKSDGKLVFSLNHDSVAQHHYTLTSPEDTDGVNSLHLPLVPKPADPNNTLVHGNGVDFIAIHISSCEGIIVVISEGSIFIVTGWEERPEEPEITWIQSTDEFEYLGFDGKHIAVAGQKGIYVLALASMKEPSYSVHEIHIKIESSGMTLFPYFFQEQVGQFDISCLQVTDTTIWYVLQKETGPWAFNSAICSIDFATPLGDGYISPDSPVLQIKRIM